MENVLVFSRDMSKIKLCDFGCTRRERSWVYKSHCQALEFLPPEIYEIVKNERYTCKRSGDCWHFAIIIFVCLTGNPPWQCADPIRDPQYSAFQQWLKRRVTKIPSNFAKFSTRMLRYFKRVFQHKASDRPQITEINKYLKDNWFKETSSESTDKKKISKQKDKFKKQKTNNSHQPIKKQK